MIIRTFIILLPLFLLCGGGFLLDRLFSLSEETLVRVVTDFFFPLLVFSSLYGAEVNGSDTVAILVSTVFVAAVMFLLSLCYCRIAGVNTREFISPIMFMNSGFLGIPLMKFLGGSEAVNLIVILDQIQTFIIFTFGIVIVTGGFTARGLREMAKSPLLWAIIAGFGCKYAGVVIPETLLSTIDFGGSAASALAIFTLGCSLSKRKMELDRHLAAGFLIRTFGGFFAGVAAVWIFRISGVTATVVIVASALPSAVFSFVLPLRYGVKPQFAGSLVFISTVLSVLTVPVSFACSRFFTG